MAMQKKIEVKEKKMFVEQKIEAKGKKSLQNWERLSKRMR